MKRSRIPSSTNPFVLWTSLAWKTGEMMLASAQVIHHRVGRMAAGAPSARDRRELALMGQEKIEAGVESASAIAAQMMTMNPLLGARAIKHQRAGRAAVIARAARHHAGPSMTRQ